jgi:hypothetical protein
VKGLLAALLLMPLPVHGAGLWSESDYGSGTTGSGIWSDLEWQTGNPGTTPANDGTTSTGSGNGLGIEWQTGNPGTTPANGGTTSTGDGNGLGIEWQTGNPGTTPANGGTTSTGSGNGLGIEWQTGNPGTTPANGGTSGTGGGNGLGVEWRTGTQSGTAPQGGQQNNNQQNNNQQNNNQQNNNQQGDRAAFTPPPGMTEIELYRHAYQKDDTVYIPLTYVIRAISDQKEDDMKSAVRYYKGTDMRDFLYLKHGDPKVYRSSWTYDYTRTSFDLSEPVFENEGCSGHYSCWYVPLDSRITEYFGYKAEWRPEDRVVTLGSKYYFKVYDDHWNRQEQLWRGQYIGTWDVFRHGLSDTVQESWGTLEIREDGTMVWDDRVQVNRGRWMMSSDTKGLARTTNGFNNYGWNLDFIEDGTLKVYGYAMTFIGFKRFTPNESPFVPPAGMKEIALKTPAFIENGQLFINAGALRSLKASFSGNPSSMRITRGTEALSIHVDNSTFFINYPGTVKPLSAKPQFIDGIWYIAAKEPMDFLNYRMTLDANNRVLLLDDEFFLKIVEKPSE